MGSRRIGGCLLHTLDFGTGQAALTVSLLGYVLRSDGLVGVCLAFAPHLYVVLCDWLALVGHFVWALLLGPHWARG